MKVDLKELMSRAYMAGFMDSAEGYNGEYPFNADVEHATIDTSCSREAAINEILQSVEVV